MRVSFIAFVAVVLYAFAIPTDQKTLAASIQSHLAHSTSTELSTITRAKQTGEECFKSTECEGSRECRYIGGDSLEACDDRKGCVCVPLNLVRCTQNSDCPGGERCLLSSENPFCVSNDIDDDGKRKKVCIAVHSLKHLSREDLVYEQDVSAIVLCDDKNSCATPGHIVHYKGRAMMMKTYCEDVGCTETVMKVNSPKYQKALRVASNSQHLSFTSFAARYETRFEESMLRTAVHMGL